MFLSPLILAGLFSTAVLALASYNTPASGGSSQVTFTNTRRLLFDVDGNQIDAYGSKINFFNGSYYLYGNSFSITGVAFGIKSYSSVDLEHWQYEGFLFDPFSTNPCDDLGGCGRPHIVYNSRSAQYILWANAGSSGYVIATSSFPSGPFRFASTRAVIDPQFDGLQPADFTVETLEDKKGYIVFSALNFRDPRAGSIWPPIFQTLHISELTSDLANTTRVSYPVRSAANDLIDQEAESPDLFTRNGWYYVAASNTCGYCNGSIGLLYRSRSIKGPWTRQILAGYSCNGQVEGVLPLTDPRTKQTTYVWHSTSVPGGPRTGFGGHIFQPLRFRPDGSVEDLDCSDNAQFQVGFTRGSGAVASGAATTAGDGSPADAAYAPICDSDQFDLFQTFRASHSGTLKSISVNIAGARTQTVPLTLTFFKFSSYADLINPEYKWTTLGSTSINSTYLSYVFNTTTVPVTANTGNATVQAGDMLGLAIAGQDFTPYCHLEYDVDEGKGVVLFQRGAGQNSWRGLKGNTSPVYVREGKGVKFFVEYA